MRLFVESVVHQPEAEGLFEAAMAEPLAPRRLKLFARSIRQRWERGADVIAIHLDAAQTDPDIRAQVENVLRRRRAGLSRLADVLEPDLPARLDPPRAAAILDALTLPELWAELTEVHGWTPDEYEAWLARSLQEQLLGR